MRAIGTAGALIAMLVIAAGVFMFYQPPLRLVNDSNGIHVDVQTLGEYPTDVARVRLLDRSTGAVIWEIRSDGAQLSTFDLHIGENPLMPSNIAWGSFKVVVPGRATSFRIERGHAYTLEVWGTSLPITKNRTTFSV